MILQSSSSSSFHFSACPCGAKPSAHRQSPPPRADVTFRYPRRHLLISGFSHRSFRRRKPQFQARAINSDVPNPNLTIKVSKSAIQSSKSFVVNRRRLAEDEDQDEAEAGDSSRVRVGSSFASFQEDPIVDKLRTQLGVIHPIPAPPINRSVAGLFVFFFFVGVVFDKVWTSRRKAAKTAAAAAAGQAWPQVPTSFSLFLEKDLQRKESVEWVNMVLGKLWKVYRSGLENWVIGLLQPVIDDLRKPGYVERVEIRQFSLGDEPLSVRNVERLTSRRVNDLQYQIGIRYTGGARALLMLSLKFGIIPIYLPFGIRDFDIDGELWVKLRLIPTEPFVGAVSVSFVALPKIKFELSPFRLFNLMAIPVLSMFLRKLLTEDLPRLFVRPKKIVLDFQKGKAVGPEGNDLKPGEQEGNKDFVGELSVTIVDARKLSYVLYGKTDPYVVLSLGDQVIRSKNNSKTTVTGPPGEPIWNQDFSMFVTNPRKQKLCIKVKDSLGFADLTIGAGEWYTNEIGDPMLISMTKFGDFYKIVDLGSLKDTVPTDRIVALQRGWGLFRKSSGGEILLRLTYKAYVEDEEDDRDGSESIYADASDSEDELFEPNESVASFLRDKTKGAKENDKESFMDVLAALIVSEEFLGIVASDTGSAKISNDVPSTVTTSLRSGAINVESPSQDSSSGSEVSRGSALFWLGVVTGVSILIALSTAGSGLFNP